jgi:hypothetical protein
LIRLDPAVNLIYVSDDTINRITYMLTLDRESADYPKNIGDYWDPYDEWKWRSVYMEGRYAENGSSEDIWANCTGTADYLTRSYNWWDSYYDNKARGLNAGCSEWGASFPHIYLDGYPNIPYSLDSDLVVNNWRFHFKPLYGWPYETNFAFLHMHINSFDVIRLSNVLYDGGTYLVIDGILLYRIFHSAVYLCFDAYFRHWFYEKGNFGSTDRAPYGIRAFGMDPDWEYENCFRSLFQHDDDFKMNLATGYDENWAGITPYN